MGRMTILVTILSWMAFAAHCKAEESPSKSPVSEQPPPFACREVEAVLQKIQQAAKELRSYECQIDYVLHQPLLESQTRRKGTIYYLRMPAGSRLRVNFETLQQDELEPQPYIEQFLFDGVWLTHVDHQVKSVKRRQMADPNKPMDAFDLAGRDLPIVGFTGMDDLRRDFDMEIISARPGQSADKVVCLSLKAKPGSRRGQDYRTIVFTVDNRLWLPAQVGAESTEGDFYDISFLQPKVNLPIEEAVFDLKVPKEFGEPEIIPLKASKGTDPTYVP
jgi:outer membrane lipoprotein-sorting protein